MLKRIMRQRLLRFLLLLVILIGLLMAPLRHIYSTVPNSQQCASCTPYFSKTEVRYGTPKAWLILSKEVDPANHNQVVSSTNRVDGLGLGIDLAFWIVILGVGAYVVRATAIKVTFPARPFR